MRGSVEFRELNEEEVVVLEDIEFPEEEASEEAVVAPPLVREQFEWIMRPERSAGLASERSLMVAMLQDAVLCLVREAAPANEADRLASDACSWVTSRSRFSPFAFENVCEALGIDVDYARPNLLRMAEASSPQHVSRHDAVRGERHSQVLSLRRGNRRSKAIHFVATKRPSKKHRKHPRRS